MQLYLNFASEDAYQLEVPLVVDLGIGKKLVGSALILLGKKHFSKTTISIFCIYKQILNK